MFLLNRNDEIFIELNKTFNKKLGFDICGGNSCGIYVKSVERWTPSEKNVPCMSQLLKVKNNIIT